VKPGSVISVAFFRRHRFNLYYSVEQIETIFRRATASGIEPVRLWMRARAEERSTDMDRCPIACADPRGDRAQR
jgi:hypothetical protein